MCRSLEFYLQGLICEEASGGPGRGLRMHAEGCFLLGFLEKQDGSLGLLRESSVPVPLPFLLQREHVDCSHTVLHPAQWSCCFSSVEPLLTAVNREICGEGSCSTLAEAKNRQFLGVPMPGVQRRSSLAYTHCGIITKGFFFPPVLPHVLLRSMLFFPLARQNKEAC